MAELVIEMKPSFVDDLKHVNASYHSVYGLIKSEWKKDDKKFTWNITVPGNTKALVYLPATSSNNVKEMDKNLLGSGDIKFIKMEGSNAVYEIGSGDYKFSVSK